MQQPVQPRPSANGYGRRKVEKEMGTRLESEVQSGKTTSRQFAGVGKGGAYQSPSRDRLIYLTTCLVGHQVEVQVLDGSVFSGILHAANTEKDSGIILKMAHLIKDCTEGMKSTSETFSKPPSKTLIIPGKEFVQVTAKGVPVTLDGFRTEFMLEKQQELLTDSCISQSRHNEVARQLERWVPDDDAPECPELENIFDGHWNRGWDQFEANETLFGVKSTFNEELYTTKLEKGPLMSELEKEALRIAREIEGEDTRDLHLAEERGIQLHGNLEVDEETRFSAVVREVDDSGYDDCEDILLDSRNDETFQGVSSTMGKLSTDKSSRKISDGAQVSSGSSSMDEVQSSQLSTSRDLYQICYDDHAKQSSAEIVPKGASILNRGLKALFSEHAGANCNNEDKRNQMITEEAQMSLPEDSKSSSRIKMDTSDRGRLSSDISASCVHPERQDKIPSSSREKLEGVVSSKIQGTAQSANSRVRPSSSALSTSDETGAASTSADNGLSRTSSINSFSLEKSTLNPHAKEFKLNPNAKSFTPSQSPLRPASPVSDNSFYYPAGVTTVPHMHGMPVGIGVGASFSAHQPVIFNPQATPVPQPYFHPNGPQYGQQMMIGHPRQVVYMPNYPTEMPFKGREY
uniref:Polyadenylate-binding protein-interacting protein 3 isoform X1 n=1 Tax=Nicotiana tabacum TaxID=4097 RepID=A0A1S3ZET6_TOBAC|nr:PREDICTED: polyadenylate-binding protein-interacting protein 3-like isoform X1 [Nicotiana tabacum]XP_016462800.1 PREDICTED: polyadenylate-binding protein-interacting protein 3-like isoform X1 [Nicotiana tabacum]XP_016462801.1 PREDICTED: polyadenylate-binding protein-interacting protein 3-like isoform X1 [Nicotiana tabacum]XP_016462803.1 PREDICTED: polyadenylate-binding protein-interacting protein 3-like isoform X1 [Nicotiana tabacum]XP_016462804.1 PREDICTED: polyadenylate-binding protein-int